MLLIRSVEQAHARIDHAPGNCRVDGVLGRGRGGSWLSEGRGSWEYPGDPQQRKEPITLWYQANLLLEIIAQQRLPPTHSVAILAIRGKVGVFAVGVAAV
jgi:hypothetical protein